MKYVLLILATLAIASPAFAGGKHHSPPGPADAAKADASVASLQSAIGKLETAGNPRPRVLGNMERLLSAAEQRAALIHAACGC